LLCDGWVEGWAGGWAGGNEVVVVVAFELASVWVCWHVAGRPIYGVLT
jgi:hypothetical protein